MAYNKTHPSLSDALAAVEVVRMCGPQLLSQDSLHDSRVDDSLNFAFLITMLECTWLKRLDLVP